MRLYTPEDTAPVRKDLLLPDRDEPGLFTFHGRIPGRIPSAFTCQAFWMKHRDFRPVDRRIPVNLYGFPPDFSECPVFSFFQISDSDRIRILLHPRIRVKCMVPGCKILKIKRIQVPVDRLKLIPDAEELHILQLCLSHIMRFQLIIVRKAVRKSGTVFSPDRVPDIIIRKKGLACPGFALRLLVEIDRPYLPGIIKIQHCLSVRCHDSVFAPLIIKAIVIFIIILLREPVRHHPGPVNILLRGRNGTAGLRCPYLCLAQKSIPVVFCILHPPQHCVSALPRLPDSIEHIFSFRHHRREFLIPAPENIALPDRLPDLLDLAAYIRPCPAVYGRDICPLRTEYDPVVKNP